tara:strand:- start:349 stop:1203 length:855 start_codon:yes stop_codon:yes gene_type:complete
MSYTYTTLKQAIQDYTQNDETTFISNFPIFIKNTEERILKNVQLELFRKNVSGSTSTSNPYLQLPDDFLSPFSLSVTSSSNYEFLQFKDVDFIKSFTPNSATTGIPRYFAVFDKSNFILAPTPNTNFTAELHYFYRPLSLTKSAFTLTLTSVSGTFITSDVITGSTSGESSGVDDVPSSTSLTVVIPSGSYTVGETITGSSSGATAVISSIGADTTISWIAENATLALLYGSLMEAYTFMKGEQDMMALYDKRFSEAMMGLKMLGESKEVTDQYRTGQIVRPKR